MSKRHFYFGIVGTGVIAHFHAQAIAQIPTATLAGIYGTSQEKSSQFASEYGGVAYSTIEELAAAPQIDIVCICTPSGIHMDPALSCIEGGKHCLIEKPLEVNLERCDRILKAANAKGVKIGVIFPSRFYPAARQLKKAIDEKRFGNLVLGMLT